MVKLYRRILVYTEAVKRKDGFAFVIARRCSVLKANKTDVSDKNSPKISLGDYNPRFFNLIYSIFVGSNELDFNAQDVNGPFNIVQHKGQNFTIVIIWSFMLSAVYVLGTTESAETFKESFDQDLLTEALRGKSSAECIDFHHDLLYRMHKEFFDGILSKYLENSLTVDVYNRVAPWFLRNKDYVHAHPTFTASGLENGPEWNEISKNLNL